MSDRIAGSSSHTYRDVMSSAVSEGTAVLVIARRVYSLATRHDHGVDSAILIRDGRIAAIGSAADLRASAPDVRVLDLGDATITPGLTDSHVHLTEWAFTRSHVDLAAATSPHDAAAAIAAAANDSPGRGWIRGRGWNPHLWGDAVPSAGLIDDLVPDRPVALQSHDMHSLWVNSAALRAAGIDAATPDPDGGSIVRDESGRPTGLLLEWAGQLVSAAIPLPTLEETMSAVVDGQRELHSLGITGVHSLPGIHIPEPDPLPVLLALREAGLLRLRVLQHIRADRLDDAIRLGLRSGFGDDWLRIGAVKTFLDGALGSRTAWMRQPYEDGSGNGMNILAEADFRDTVTRAAAAGIASVVHAIGDAAVCLALDVLADPAVRVRALPHRIEHLQCCPVDRLGDAAAAGIVCSMQPSHMITDWRIADRYWGAERSRGAFANGSLQRSGTVLAFGSDAPVEPVDPRRGLFAAVFRQDYEGQPQDGWFAEQRIGALDALLGYTVGPARAAGLPAPAGTLAPGAPADIAAWDIDPVTQPERTPDMHCVATIVAGELVHHT